MFRSTLSVGPRLRRSGGFFSAVIAVALVLVPVASTRVAAQQPTRPDTTRAARPDTGAAAADTGAARRVPRDTTPPPQLPELVRPVPAGFSTGVWVFTRDSIERFSNAVTLADLLEMLPGITRVRSGYFVQPEAVSSLGQTGGRTEVFLDGYALDPLSAGVPDLTRIELAGVSSVRVERRLDVLRIDITSLSPTSYQPYAYIQAGVAEPNAKLFRGGFLTPHLLIGPLSFGVDRLDTNGTGGAEPGDATGGWLKWGKIWRDRGGIQLEARSNSVHRNQTVPWIGTYSSSDVTLRGRWRLLPGLTGEAYVGSSSVSDPNLVPDSATGFSKRFVPPAPPTLPPLPMITPKFLATYDSINALQADTLLDRSDKQLGAHLTYVGPTAWGDAALRTHSATRLARVEGDLSAGLRAPGLGDVDGGVHLESWTERQVTDLHGRGRLGPFRGLTAFAEISSGERGVPFLRDTVADRELFSKRSAWRAGVDLDRAWLSAGIARLSVSADSIPGFGLPFDLAPRFYPAGTMTGWESHARVRLFWKPLSAEYWYVVWTQFAVPAGTVDSIAQPVYTPDQEYRASLVYHQSPLPSGHLELYARLDARSRGNTFAAVAPTTVVPAVNSLDFFLQIRILDVRIFFQEVGMLAQKGKRPFDIPGGAPGATPREYPAPRIYYGVRWQFFD